MKKTTLMLAVFVLAGPGAWAGGPSSFDMVMENYEPIRLALLGDSMEGVNAHGKAIATAESLETARDGFYALTKPMVLWREGASRSDRPAVAYCPMHKRSWLQPGDEIGNPYGGMPGCGSIVSNFGGAR